MVRKRKARVLTPEELSALTAALREPARTIFLTGAPLGLCTDELLARRVGDINLLEAPLHAKLNVYWGKVGTPKTAARKRKLPVPIEAGQHQAVEQLASELWPTVAQGKKGSKRPSDAVN